jgi:osmotically-inducible protein OsmY
MTRGQANFDTMLSVFLRPDEQIAAEIQDALAGLLLAGSGDVTVTVREGVAVLSGGIARDEQIPAAERLAGSIDGVVSVVCKLTAKQATSHAPSPGGN